MKKTSGWTRLVDRRRGILLSFCLLAFVGTCSCRQAAKNVEPPRALNQPRMAGGPEIRVAALKDAADLRVASPAGGARIFDAAGVEIRRISAGGAVRVDAGPAGLVLDGNQSVSGAFVRIEGLSRDQFLQLNEQDMAPRLVIHFQNRRLLAVAHLDLEDYLVGVLAGEVPYNKWHPEALKAQAVTSRSYAWYQMRQSSNRVYDVECTVMSQVFKAGFRNNPILTEAVNATRGLALTDNGNAFSAYFHSTCGGQTERAELVFPEQAGVRALRGANCSYCQGSPNYRWTWSLSKQALGQKLAAGGYAVGAVSRVEFLDGSGAIIATRNPPARAAQVRVTHASGALPLQGNAFRLLAGPRDLKSLLIEQIVDRGDTIEISGGGFGHGVGLCQYGSQGMAVARAKYASILGSYFPGAELTKIY
jgi:stage II sporulation protein D